MNRYQLPFGSESTWEPGSHSKVLRNLLGIKRKSEMDRAEFDALVAAQTTYYKRLTEDTKFSAALICKMHKDWLGKIYKWAGRYRTLEVSKGGFTWPPAYLIADHMSRFETDQLSKHTPCRRRELADVCLSIAIVHAELLLIHPFREGNGRIARWVADVMAAQAGFPPPLYKFNGKGSKEVSKRYLHAVTRGYVEDYDALARFFEDAVLARLSL